MKSDLSDLASSERVAPGDQDNVDRIVLKRLERSKLDSWLAQLNEKFDGMIRFTKSDLANFLIRNHANDLNDDEIDTLASEHYDEMRWLNWAVAKIRKAKKEGIQLSLDELMVKRKPADTVKKSNVKRPRKIAPQSANDQSLLEPAAAGLAKRYERQR